MFLVVPIFDLFAMFIVGLIFFGSFFLEFLDIVNDPLVVVLYYFFVFLSCFDICAFFISEQLLLVLGQLYGIIDVL